MPEAWRIVKARHAATAFTGEGAAKTGGRWNSRGMAVVYASGSQSLATLETLVHLNPPLLFNYVIFQIKFDDELMEMVSTPKLPADWRSEPPPPSTKAVGDAWVRETRSAILAVPSVIITEEINYLFNPAHPDFKKVTLGKPRPFIFDPRLVASVTSSF